MLFLSFIMLLFHASLFLMPCGYLQERADLLALVCDI